MSTSSVKVKPSLKEAQRHIELLAGSPDTKMCFRFADGNKIRKKKLPRHNFGPCTVAELWSTIEEYQADGFAVYIVVNEGGHKAADITRIRAQFVDCDGTASLRETDFHIPPTFSCKRSEVNWHAWWRVDGNVPVEDFTRLQLQLAAHYGTDDQVADLPRLMRLAGTVHQKVEKGKNGEPVVSPPTLITIEEGSGAVYNEWDIAGGLRELPPEPERSPVTGDFKPLPLSELRDQLAVLSPYTKLDGKKLDRDSWRNILVAIHQCIACPVIDADGNELGEDELRELAREWSRGDIRQAGADKWPDPHRMAGGDVDEIFRTMEPREKGKGPGPGTIWQLACEAGYKPPRPSVKEAFKHLETKDKDGIEEELISRRGDEIEPKAVRWMWPNRYPFDKVSLLAGHGDLGKTTALLDIAARITTGRAWPDDSGNAPLGDVIYMSSEDDPDDTLLPRFMAAKGNREKIHFIDGVRRKDGVRAFNMVDDLDLLDKKIRAVGNVVAVILDPINSYFGDTDTWRANKVRAALEPLRPFAKKHGIAFIGNTHFNKAAKGGGSANMRILDSQAISNVVRSIYVVMKDPENEHARLFLRSKGNNGPAVDGLRFYFKTRLIQEGLPAASYVDWSDDAVKASADGTLRANEGEAPKRTKTDDACDFFRDMLADGPLPTNKVMMAGIAEGHTEATLNVARRRLKIASIPPANPSEKGGVWMMALPGKTKPPKLKLVVNNPSDW